MKARVFVTLKKGVLDPQGKAVQSGLRHLGFDKIRDVRVGKVIDIEMDDTDLEDAQRQLRDMCEKLLANIVIEDYHFEIEKDGEKVTDVCIMKEGKVIG